MKYGAANKLIRLTLGLLLVLALLPIHICAQSLTANVSRNPVGVDEQFQLTFTLNTSGSSFTPPSLNDFIVLSGPNQSNSMQIINGSVSQSISFSYILQPRKTGTFKIGPGTANVNGKAIQSNPITLNVVAGSGGQSQGGSQSQDDKNNISSGNVFIRVSVDKKQVFKGEALVATFRLFTNVQVINYSINKVPSFTGFWNQDIEMPKQMSLHNETLNGVTYQVGEIKKVVLYPQQSGTLTIEPMEGEIVARIRVKRARSNNPFDIFSDPFDPFFGSGGIRDVPYAIKSDPIRITVRDLPEGAPASFNGAVGKFSLETLVDRQDIKTNDAVNIRIKISGKGNLQLLESPLKDIPSDLESYDPKITDYFSTNIQGTSGTRTFEHLIIPRIPGEYELGPIAFSYFNPESGKYENLSSPVLKLNVKKGKGDGAVAVTGSKSDFRIIGRDIKYIRGGNGNLKLIAERFWGSFQFWTFLTMPLLIMAGLILYRRRDLALRSDLVALKSHRATAMAKKKLKTADEHLKKGNNEGFYEETGKALWGYISDKLRIPVSDLTRDHASGLLRQNGISENTLTDLIGTIDACEFARYGGKMTATDASNTYSKTVELITKVENELSK